MPGASNFNPSDGDPLRLVVSPATHENRAWRVFAFFSVAVLLTGVVSVIFADLLWRTGWSPSRTVLLVLFIIPQMVMSGALVPLAAPQRAPAQSSWALQNVIYVSGAGSDVAQDACWNKTEEEREDMTLDEKNEQCTCMGENALRLFKIDRQGNRLNL